MITIEMASEFFTMFVPLCLVLWFFWLLKSRNSKLESPQPPGPRGLPLVGYLPYLGTNLHREFTKLATVYGPVFKLQLGTQPCVVISSPSLVKEMVRDHDIVFSNREETVAASIITYGGKDIAFSSYGPYWRKMRKIFVGEMLSNSSLSACYSPRKQAVAKSMNHVFDRIGTPVKVGALAFTTVVNAVMNMLLGNTADQEQEQEQEFDFGAEFMKITTEVMVLLGKSNVSDFFSVLERFDLQGIERQSKMVNSRCDQLLDSAINRFKNSVEKEKKLEINDNQRRSFMRLLLDLMNHQDREKSISLTELKALLMDILIGGTDTTSTMTEWVIAELLKHPETMKKVQNELTQVIGKGNDVEEFHLQKLYYLNAVVKETLRLHPALPLLVPRFSGQSTIVGGYNIPESCRVYLNVWAIHRDPTLWEDPSGFKPERFLNDSSGNNNFDFSGNNFQFLPFGSGRRICAGLSLAEKMLMYLLASLLHLFEWKLPDGAKVDLSERFGIVTKLEKPLLAIPIPRSAN